MIILDTNVVSELIRSAPQPHVASWSQTTAVHEVFLTSVTRAELRAGIARMPHGAKRVSLEYEVDGYLNAMAERTLPFDNAAADLYGLILADRSRAGRPISYPDAQIAAITRAHAATLATRNVRDFQNTGITVVNPFEDA